MSNTQQQANFAFKRSLRVPCTNTSIVDPHLESSLTTKRIVYSNELYTNPIPSTPPAILFRFTNGTGNISVYNVNTTITLSNTQTNVQLIAAYGGTDALWTSLKSGSIAALSTCGLTIAVCYVEKLPTSLIDGTLAASPTFYASLLIDSIPQLPVTITTSDGTASLPNANTGNWILIPESGLLTFFDNTAVSLNNGTTINLFPTTGATTQTWFNAANPPKVSCWVYTGLIGAIPSLSYDQNSVLTTVAGGLTVTGNLVSSGNLVTNGSTTLQGVTAAALSATSMSTPTLTSTTSSLGTATASTVTTTGLLHGATLQADGASTLANVSTSALTATSLSVTGGSAFTGAITGPVTFANAVSLSSTLTATGIAQFSNAVLSGTLTAPTISGATALTGALSGVSASLSGALSSGSLSVSGTSQFSGGISGATTFNGSVGIASGYSLTSVGTGATSLGGALTVTGSSVLNGGISNALTVNNTFRATGAVTLDDALSIGKTISMNGFITPNSSGTNSSLNKGYLFGPLTSTNYALYMANTGAGNSITGNTIPNYTDVTGYGMRFRMAKNSAYGFVFENDTEQSVASINASTGNFNLLGTANVNALSVTNASTLNTANITNAAITTLGVTGTATIGTLNSTTTSLGSASSSTLSVSGISTLASTNTGALTASSLSSTGATTVGTALTVTNGTTLNTLTVTGASSLAVVSQSGSSTFASGSGAFSVNGPLSVNATSTLAGAVSLTGTNTLTTGTGLVSLGGNMTVSGVSSLNTATVGGALTVNGASTFNNSVAVSGSNGLTVGTGALTTSGNLSIAGTTQLTGAVTTSSDLSVGGNLSVTGSFTTVNTNTVNVTDKQITLASNQSTGTAIDAGGMYLGNTGSVSILYSNANGAWTSSKLWAAPSYIVGAGTNTTTATGSSWSTTGLSFGASTANLQIGATDVSLSKTGLSFGSGTANVATGTLSASGTSTLAGVTATSLSTSGLATLNSASITNTLTVGGAFNPSTISTGTLSTSGLATLNSASITSNLSVGGTFNPTSISTSTVAATTSITSARMYGTTAIGTVTAGATNVIQCVAVGSHTGYFTGTVYVTITGTNNSDALAIEFNAMAGTASTVPSLRVNHSNPLASGLIFSQVSVTNGAAAVGVARGLYVYYACGSNTSGVTLTCNVSAENNGSYSSSAFTPTVTPISDPTAAINGASPDSGSLVPCSVNGGMSYSGMLTMRSANANASGTPTTVAGMLTGTKIAMYPATAGKMSLSDYNIGVGVNSDMWLNALARVSQYISGVESSYTSNMGIVLPISTGSMIDYALSNGAVGTTAATKIRFSGAGIGTTPSSITDYALGMGSASMWINTPSGSKLSLTNSGSEIMNVSSSGVAVTSRTLTTTGSVGIGTASPQSALHIYGNVNTVPSVAGIHMGFVPGSTNRVDVELCASDATGDCIIDFTTPNTDLRGRIYYNFPTDYMAFSTAGNECMRLTNTGVLKLPDTGVIDTGNGFYQKINLYGAGTAGSTNYGIGIQSYTMYFRSGDGNFQWFKSGVHGTSQDDPGSGGTSLMKLDSRGTLYLANNRLPSMQLVTYTFSQGTAQGIGAQYTTPILFTFVARNTIALVQVQASGILHTTFSVNASVDAYIRLYVGSTFVQQTPNSAGFIYLGNTTSVNWSLLASGSFNNMTVGQTYGVAFSFIANNDSGMDTTAYSRYGIVNHGSS